MKRKRGLLLLLGLLILTACQGEQTVRLWLKTPGWSRAQVIGGMGIPDPAPLAIDQAGNNYFLFIDGEFEELQAQVVAMNDRAERLWEHTFSEIIELPDDPHLIWDGTNLHAFWISGGTLVTAELDQNGTVLQEPVILSDDIRVDSYSAVGTQDGRLAVWFASDRRQPGVYQVDFEQGRPVPVDAEGVLPALRFDASGTLHATWAHYPRGDAGVDFYYGRYPDGDFTLGNEIVLYETTVPQTATMIGPTLGIDTNDIYLYWVQIFRTGLEAGTTVTRYISFPFDAPDQLSSPQQIVIPVEHDLAYDPFPGETLLAGERYSLQSPTGDSVAVLQDINTNPVALKESAVIFRAGINYYWRRAANQIAVVYMEDGAPTSYQLLSFTQQPSTDPVVVSDQDGYLYATWLEIGDVSRYNVLFAGTSTGLQETFNPVTFDDVSQLSVATAFGLLTGVLLAPFAAMLFLVLPAITVVITSIFRRGEQTLRSPGTIMTLIVATIIYQFVKIAVFPDITEYVPFSAWLPLPNLVKAPLQIIVPVVIMIIGLVTAWNFTYRRNNSSPFFFVLLYIAVDSLFTMAIYGVLFYGAF